MRLIIAILLMPMMLSAQTDSVQVRPQMFGIGEVVSIVNNVTKLLQKEPVPDEMKAVKAVGEIGKLFVRWNAELQDGRITKYQYDLLHAMISKVDVIEEKEKRMMYERKR